MLKKLKNYVLSKDGLVDGALVAFAVGLVSELLGVDIAPTEVDALMTGLAALAAIIGRWRAKRAEPVTE